MSLVSNYSLLSCPFSSPWLHLIAVQQRRAGYETLPVGSDFCWPHLPARQRWEPVPGRRIWPRFGGRAPVSPVQVRAHPPAAPLQTRSTRTAAHLRCQQRQHEFLTPLFTEAAVAFGPIHCTRCAILVLCGGEIPVLIHIECAQQSVRKVAVWREKSKRDFCDPYWISYFNMNIEYSMKVSK